MVPVVLALGSNIDNPLANLDKATHHLKRELGKLVPSTIYKSAPLEYFEQPEFYNMAVYAEVDNALSLSALFTLCQAIETEMERVKRIPKGPRNIDIDIIFYGSENRARVVGGKLVIVPHLRYPMRQFVLLPLRDIERRLGRSFTHPVLKLTTEQFKQQEPWGSVLKGQQISEVG